LLFIFFPNIRIKEKIIPVTEVIFSTEDIPATIQNENKESTGHNTFKTPVIAIKPINDDTEILGDAEVKENSSMVHNIRGNGKDRSGEDENSNITFIPRQIKEVLPRESNEKVKGFIKLSLMIGKDGKVKRYILLYNSTNSIECLNNVLDALHRSRWQVARLDGREIEYWIEKTYNFK